jgi:hypothetical protein
MNNESTLKGKELTTISLLKTLEDMMHNRIKQKQEEMYKTQNIAENDKLSIEIDTLHWVIAQSLSVRRPIERTEESNLIYDTTTITRERR